MRLMIDVMWEEAARSLQLAIAIWVLFVWFIIRIFSVNEQYFSLIINKQIILLSMAFQPNEQGNGLQSSDLWICRPKRVLCCLPVTRQTRMTWTTTVQRWLLVIPSCHKVRKFCFFWTQSKSDDSTRLTDYCLYYSNLVLLSVDQNRVVQPSQKPVTKAQLSARKVSTIFLIFWVLFSF
jgi:hypothetical protein